MLFVLTRLVRFYKVLGIKSSFLPLRALRVILVNTHVCRLPRPQELVPRSLTSVATLIDVLRLHAHVVEDLAVVRPALVRHVICLVDGGGRLVLRSEVNRLPETHDLESCLILVVYLLETS